MRRQSSMKVVPRFPRIDDRHETGSPDHEGWRQGHNRSMNSKGNAVTSSGCWKQTATIVVVLQLGLTALWLRGDNGMGSIMDPLAAVAPRSVGKPHLLREELEEALERWERRVVATVGAGVGEAARTDVSRLLESIPPGSSPEREKLEKMQYCDRFRNLSAVPAQFMEPWIPTGDKFLLSLCRFGQMSNRLLCMRNSILFAALLNRTLLVPQRETGYKGYGYRLAFDVPHARRCVGDAANNTIMWLEDYQAAMAAPGQAANDVKVVVDRVFSFKIYGKQDYFMVWRENTTVELPSRADEVGKQVTTARELREVLGKAQERLISPGDLFGISKFPDLPDDFYNRPNPAFRNLSCSLFIQPHPAIVQVAKGLVRTVLGPDFLAIHLRRGDFHAYWNDKECRRQSSAVQQACRLRPLQIVASCVLEKVRGSNMSVVFAATNAFPLELALLEKLLAPLALVTLPRSFQDQAFKWATPWIDMKLDKEPLAFASLDKVVCAMSKVFMGTVDSTFTDDIVTMRAALGTLSCQDQDLCAPFHDDSNALPFFNETDPQFHLTFR